MSGNNSFIFDDSSKNIKDEMLSLRVSTSTIHCTTPSPNSNTNLGRAPNPIATLMCLGVEDYASKFNFHGVKIHHVYEQGRAVPEGGQVPD